MQAKTGKKQCFLEYMERKQVKSAVECDKEKSQNLRPL
jgi:hypothetical protein